MSRKTNYSMREYKELMDRADDACSEDTIFIEFLGRDIGRVGIEEVSIAIEDLADFLNVMLLQYNITRITIGDSRYTDDWVSFFEGVKNLEDVLVTDVDYL